VIRERAAALRDALKAAAGTSPGLVGAFPGEPPAILWIAAAGDLMLGRGAEGILLREGPGGIFGETAALIREADLAVVNLEGAVSRRGTRAEKTYNFRFDPASVAALKEAGIDAVLQANNHAFDWGREAFLDTLDHLDAAGIGVLGAGRDEAGAAAPFVFSGIPGGAPVRCYGIASFPRERSGWDGIFAAAGVDSPGILHTGKGGEALLRAALSADQSSGGAENRAESGAESGAGNAAGLRIVFFHGGEEWSSRPGRATRELCANLVRAGADLIIGSHPHIVQGFEWVGGKPVFWSLGNYVFAGMEDTGGGDEGLFIMLGFVGKALRYLEPYPLSLKGPRTDIAPPEKLERFYRLSRELSSRELSNRELSNMEEQ
jgi:poly-gamma-glutamate synthesis protein (capsule biosynthesis protein)